MISVLGARNVIRLGETIQLFNNRLSVPSSQAWTFDAGAIGSTTDDNPLITYTTVGRKAITYTPSSGSAEKKVDYIVVVPDYTTPDHTYNLTTLSATTFYIDASSWQGGDIVEFTGNYNRASRFVIRNARGEKGNPILIVNNGLVEINATGTSDGALIFDSCHDVWMAGCGDSNYKYGFKLNRGTWHWNNYGGTTAPVNRDIKYLAMEIAGVGGDVDCCPFNPKALGVSRNTNAECFDDYWQMHCKTTNTRTEGTYCGYFNYYYREADGFYTHTMKRARIAWNEYYDSGYDGLQLGCADEGASVHDNKCINSAQLNTVVQNFAAVLNTGFAGEFYNNLLEGNENGTGQMLQVLLYNDTKVYNNIIVGKASGAASSCLFGRTTPNNNPDPLVKNMEETAYLKIFNNTFYNRNDAQAVYLLDYDSAQLQDLLLRNNALRYGTNTEGAVDLSMTATSTNVVGDNYESENGASSLFFEDEANGNYDIPTDSPLLSAGADLSVEYADTELGLYDFNGYAINTTDWHVGSQQLFIDEIRETMSNLNIPDKSNFASQPSVPENQKLNAADFNSMKDWINRPGKPGTTFNDAIPIVVDETVTYSTKRIVTGSTHEIMFATTGNVPENYKKVLYEFQTACTLALIDYNSEESTTGTVNDIQAGTYPFWFFPATDGTLALFIQNNTGTTPGTLSTPTLVLTAIDGGFNYVKSGIDGNATDDVLEYSTNNVDWTTDTGNVFGVNSGSVTGLTNGILYYGRLRVSASGYNPSGYATDTVTPSGGVTQLTQPTGLTATKKSELVTLDFDAIDANADSVSIFRSLSSGSGFTVLDTISRNLTSYEDDTVTNDTPYYYYLIANGSGVYSNSDPSSEVTATPSYVFANTYKLVISSVGDGVSVINNIIDPSGAFSFEIKGDTMAAIATSAFMRIIDDDDDFIMSDLQFGGSAPDGEVTATFRTDGSNRLVKLANSPGLLESTSYHVVVVKEVGDDYDAVKIYINGSVVTSYNDNTVGTYAGVRSRVGNLVLEVPRLNLAAAMVGIEYSRAYNDALTSAEVLAVYNGGTPVGLEGSGVLDSARGKCVQESLYNNNANAINIGEDGTTEGSATYSTI